MTVATRAVVTPIPAGDIPVASGAHVDHFQWERMPSWDSRRPLEAGDMIHPGMYGTVNGGAFEHDVLVTETGAEILSDHVRSVWWE